MSLGDRPPVGRPPAPRPEPPTGPPPRILVVDEEPAITRAVRAGLDVRGYAVDVAASAAEALDHIATRPPDVVLLDLGLPDGDGLDVVRRVREWTDLPVIVLSGDAHDGRKVLALDAGADDYVTKPFSMPELLARVRVALRHRARTKAVPDDAVLVVGDVCIDVAHHTCRVDERDVDLTPKEFAFLSLLARWPGRVLTHRMILQEVWGPAYGDETQYLRTYATNLRRKLGDTKQRRRLVSEPGVGYRLVDVTGAATGDPGAPGGPASGSGPAGAPVA